MIDLAKSKLGIDHRVRHSLQLMNVPNTVTLAELKIQYHKLAKIFHPDMQQSKQHSTKMEGRFRQLQESYEVLKVKIVIIVL